MTKRVLITGAAGFTGWHILNHLQQQGYQVWGTTRTSRAQVPALQCCDFTDPKQITTLVKQIRPQYVLHFAARAFAQEADTLGYYQHNVLATEHLLNALSALSGPPKRVILASSAAVYGNQGKEQLDESLCPKPAGHYGISKLAMEHIAHGFADKLPIVCTRPFNYTGVGQREPFLIPKLVRHFQQRAPVIELGNIDVAREFNDVRDVARWYTALMQTEQLPNPVINLASGQAHTIREMIRLLEEIAGYQIEIKTAAHLKRANDQPVLTGASTRLQAVTGEPLCRYTIAETLAWMYQKSPLA